jgi:hypothetical protein
LELFPVAHRNDGVDSSGSIRFQNDPAGFLAGRIDINAFFPEPPHFFRMNTL